MLIPGLNHLPVAWKQVPRLKRFYIHMRFQTMWVVQVKANLPGAVSRAQDQIGTARRLREGGVRTDPIQNAVRYVGSGNSCRLIPETIAG